MGSIKIQFGPCILLLPNTLLLSTNIKDDQITVMILKYKAFIQLN